MAAVFPSSLLRMNACISSGKRDILSFNPTIATPFFIRLSFMWCDFLLIVSFFFSVVYIWKSITVKTWNIWTQKDCFKFNSPKGDIAIKCIFSLVFHDYNNQIFKLVQIFHNLHQFLAKYINFSKGITSQQFVAFKFIKICVYHIHPSFSCFHTGYNFDQISRKCRDTFQRYKRWNVEGRNAMQFQNFNFLSMRKRFAWKCDVCH